MTPRAALTTETNQRSEEKSVDRLAECAFLGASLGCVETLLTFGTGRVPLRDFPWVAGAPLLISFACLILARVLDRFSVRTIWTTRLIILSPAVIFSLRGGDDPNLIGGAGSGLIRVLTLILLFFLVHRLIRVGGSLGRIGLTQLTVAFLSALVFLVRTVPLAAIRHPARGLEAEYGVGALIVTALASAGLAASSGARRFLPSLMVLSIAGVYASAFGNRIVLSTDLSVPKHAAQTRALPNVIVLVIDTARRDAFSIYGSRNPTPATAAFAAESTTFTNARTTGTYSLVGHASLFSGLLASRHGAHGSPEGDLPLRSGVELLAEELTGLGYTALGVSANPWYLEAWTGLQKGFASFWSGQGRHYWFWPTSNVLRLRAGLVAPNAFKTAPFSADAILGSAAKAVAAAPPPFFLFANLMEVHDPFPRETASRTSDRRVAYADAIGRVDESLGRFLSQVRGSMDWDNTLILVTSDHGEFFGEHNQSRHLRVGLYESILQIPLIVKFPKQHAPERVSDLITLADLKPLIDAAVRGERWTPSPSSMPRVVAENWWDSASGKMRDRMVERAVYREQIKLIERRSGLDELFDLSSDVAETDNLLKSRPDLAQSLRASMLKDLPSLASAELGLPRNSPVIPPELLERMRAIGYIR